VAALEPDVLVVLGDDQQEFHDDTNLPAIGVYYGDRVTMGTSMRFATYQEELGDATPLMRGYAMDRRHSFPGHEPLARGLIASLLEQGFDVAASGGVPDDGVSGLGHAFGIVETQLLGEPGAIPLVPVLVTTYWPPNQLPVSRCYDLGVALRRAIEGFDEELRVLVVASGGLSHFSTDEELDGRVLDACRSGSEEALRGFEPELLNGGSSEIRNWIAVAAACRGLPLAWDEYLPVYRTPVGTGVGLAFALWRAG
jgi:Catalytic LigB subunit of aromatic ring-opening dioxygenase